MHQLGSWSVGEVPPNREPKRARTPQPQPSDPMHSFSSSHSLISLSYFSCHARTSPTPARTLARSPIEADTTVKRKYTDTTPHPVAPLVTASSSYLLSRVSHCIARQAKHSQPLSSRVRLRPAPCLVSPLPASLPLVRFILSAAPVRRWLWWRFGFKLPDCALVVLDSLEDRVDEAEPRVLPPFG